MKNRLASTAFSLGLICWLMLATAEQNTIQAEAEGPTSLGFNFNFPTATGETSDVLKNGFGFGLDMGYRPETSPFGLRFDMIYSNFDLTSEVLNNIRFADSGWASMWGFDLSAVLTPPNADKVRPYIQFGPGFYYQHAEATRFSGSGGVYCDPWFGCYNIANEESVADFSTWRLGWMGGAGLNFEFDGGGAMYVQAQYHMINNANTKTEFIPIAVGFRQTF
jgi:opacity protein-like surface antigen